jgi:hypothetical protein
MASPCASRGLNALNERRSAARALARQSANKLAYGEATSKNTLEARYKTQIRFYLTALGGQRFRSLLRMAADRKFRVAGKSSAWKVKLDQVTKMASTMSTAFMANASGGDSDIMIQAIEHVMTHGPCSDAWIRCHERFAGVYGLAVAVGREAAIDVAACPTEETAERLDASFTQS